MRVCTCGHADRDERMAADMTAWEAEHGAAPEGHGWSAEWVPDGVGGLTFKGAVLLPVAALRLS